MAETVVVASWAKGELERLTTVSAQRLPLAFTLEGCTHPLPLWSRTEHARSLTIICSIFRCVTRLRRRSHPHLAASHRSEPTRGFEDSSSWTSP